jgi:hypothetical protein
VSFDKVTGSKRCAERQLTGKDTSGDNTRELTGVITGACRVSTTDAKQIEHGRLRLENCATTNGADLNTRHRDRDLKVAMETVEMLAYG